MNPIQIYSNCPEDCELIKFMLAPHQFAIITACNPNEVSFAFNFAFTDLSLPQLAINADQSVILLAEPDQTIDLIHHHYPHGLVTLVKPLKRSDLSRALELIGIDGYIQEIRK